MLTFGFACSVFWTARQGRWGAAPPSSVQRPNDGAGMPDLRRHEGAPGGSPT